MPRIYVHDYKVEKNRLGGLSTDDDFFCGVTIYFNFSKEEPGDGWDDLEYFFISVASPMGLGVFLKQSIANGSYPSRGFFSHILIFDKFDEKEIIDFIKDELQSIYGQSENEIILKAIRNFDWEYENMPEVYNKLFK